MKVENSGINRINRQEAENLYAVDKNLRSNETVTAEGLSGKDKATVSEQARLLAKARVSMDETPDIRSERVDELRSQIQSGNYQVPVEELVKRLVMQFRNSQDSEEK